MIQLDHIAITVNDLEKSIKFYENIGYKLQNKFNDQEYKWAELELGATRLEIFEPVNSTKKFSKISHIAYNFTEDEEAFEIATKTGHKVGDSDMFYGDLNRKSFFIEDNSGISIQLIKKKI